MNSSVKTSVQNYWDASPCGTKFAAAEPGTPAFFQEVESHRYRLEPHILELAPFQDARGKNVLEIGSGLGTDGVQFAKAGAYYSALDLSPKSLNMARKNFGWRGLSGNFQVGDSENIPFADGSFDFVYSHGVIHHTPNMQAAVNEIHRVLKPGGKAVIMVYHKNSLNYYLGIQFLRKVGAFLLYWPGGVQLVHLLTGEKQERLLAHSSALRQQGLKYLTGPEWLNNNTDGPGNPLSSVWSSRELSHVFGRFAKKNTKVRFLNLDWFRLLRTSLPNSIYRKLGRRLGWHLYMFAQK
jgi:ubiquinone/menaquinone biosynthesis C-methylase UbiE